jgi:hypothetical protein
MTTKPSIGKPRRGKLKITNVSVLRIIESYYELKGLKVAMEKLEQLNELFSTEPGWNEASAEIIQYLTEKRKEEQQKQREEKLEELRTAAPTISVTSEAKAVGKAEVEQMDVDVKSPGNNIARIINIGDSKDNE